LSFFSAAAEVFDDRLTAALELLQCTCIILYQLIIHLQNIAGKKKKKKVINTFLQCQFVCGQKQTHNKINECGANPSLGKT
jgi:hypothetical protein